MKTFAFLVLALCGCIAHGQSSLDQDPKERAADKAFFSHPPVSSVGAAPTAFAKPSPSPTPLNATTPEPTPATLVQTMLLDVQEISSGGTYPNNECSIRVQATVPKSGLDKAHLEIVFVASGKAVDAAFMKVSVTPLGALDETFYHSDRYGREGSVGWIVRLVSADRKVLAWKGSEGALEAIGGDGLKFQSFTENTKWTED